MVPAVGPILLFVGIVRSLESVVVPAAPLSVDYAIHSKTRATATKNSQHLRRIFSPLLQRRTLLELLPTVIMSKVVHIYSAAADRLLDAIDSSAVYSSGR